MSLDELLCAARALEPGAGDELGTKLSQRLIRFFAAQFDQETARELAQRVLCVIYAKLPDFEPRDDTAFERWVFASARIIAQDHVRRQFREAHGRARLEALPRQPDTGPSSWFARKQQARLVAEEYGELDDHVRRALDHFLDERDPASVAREEGIAPGTVRSRRHRARKELARRVQARAKTPTEPGPGSQESRERDDRSRGVLRGGLGSSSRGVSDSST